MTQVESFLVEEVKELVTDPDKLDEWNKKVDELELEGQKKLASPGKSPIPFVFMNETMERVYKTLCPHFRDIKNYDKTAIPLQVLSLVSLCIQEKYFDSISIWSDEREPDPICVGYAKKDKKYIIARWGDELRSFPELLDLAKKRKITELKSKLSESSSKMKEALNNPDPYIDKYFNGDWVYFEAYSM